MSYYDTKHKFNLSIHARERIKKRMNIAKNTSDIEIDIIINNELQNLKPTYQFKECDYYKIPNYNHLYAIVIRKSKLIKTVTQIHPEQISKLFDR